VGASEADPGTKVAASDGGGRSEGELPGALDGERTAAPPSCVGEDPPRNRPSSPMDTTLG